MPPCPPEKVMWPHYFVHPPSTMYSSTIHDVFIFIHPYTRHIIYSFLKTLNSVEKHSTMRCDHPHPPHFLFRCSSNFFIRRSSKKVFFQNPVFAEKATSHLLVPPRGPFSKRRRRDSSMLSESLAADVGPDVSSPG